MGTLDKLPRVADMTEPRRKPYTGWRTRVLALSDPTPAVVEALKRKLSSFKRAQQAHPDTPRARRHGKASKQEKA